MLKRGERAPRVHGWDQEGREIELEALLERGPVVLYFYPRDFTRVCTREACMFRDAYAELQDKGATVIGVSVDDEATHRRFAEQHGIGFSLLPDANREISRAYGVLRAFDIFTKRVTFVIDTAGVVRGVFHYELNTAKHVEQVKQLLDTLRNEAPAARARA